MAEKNKKTTYAEISRTSGVSAATISRILNKSTNVTKETRQKVIEVMNELGYDTSELMVMPHNISGDLLFFNIPSLDNPFYSLIIQGAKSSATRHQFNLLINEGHVNDKTFNEFVALLKKTRAAGLITTNHIAPDLLKRLNGMIPLVQCCECEKEMDIPFVTIDDIAAAQTAVDYILSIGKRRVAFINGPMRYKYARDRLAGYLQSLEKAGIARDNDLIMQLQEVSFDMAVSAAVRLLSSAKRPEAFFTISDVYAAAVIKAAERTGLSVPHDIAVVGFDNIELSSMMSPSITTVNQPKFQLGFLSCEILTERIINEQSVVKNMYLETELIVRESTAIRR